MRRAWLRRTTGTVMAVIAIGGGVLIEDQHVGTGGGGGAVPGTANLWIDSNGGSCTRSATPIAYNDANACSSANVAYHAAVNGAGDTVNFVCGSYPGGQAFTVDATKTSTVDTVFQPVTPYCASVSGPVNVIRSAAFNIGSADHITVQDFVLYSSSFTSNPGAGAYAAAVLSNANVLNDASVDVSILRNHINPGTKIDGCCAMLLSAVTNWVIRGNVIGPMCCGSILSTTPEGIRANKGVSGTPTCFNSPCNLTIDNNTLQYVIRDQTLWPSSGWGAVPDTSCFASGCHMDSIHMWGCITCSITNNRIYGGECQAIFFEAQQGSMTSDVDVIGNAISPVNSCSSKAIDFTFFGTTPGFGGTINVKFNSAPGSNIMLGLNCGSATPGTIVNIVGNVGSFFDENCSGNQANCTVGAAITATWKYNVWATAVQCDPTDAVNTSTSSVSAALAPAVGIDMHLAGGTQTADNFVPTSVAGGCPSSDFDGNTRPIGANCDAGADER